MLEQIKADIKTSLLAGDRFRVDALKMAQAALMNAKIAKQDELTAAEEIAVIQKEIKKRKEAAEMYANAGVQDKSQNELTEASILEAYVPTLISGVELSQLVDEFIAKNEGISFSDAMPKAVAELGNVDKSQLAGLLKTKLS